MLMKEAKFLWSRLIASEDHSIARDRARFGRKQLPEEGVSPVNGAPWSAAQRLARRCDPCLRQSSTI